MGGTVSLSTAIQYPHRVQKVVVIGSPIAQLIVILAEDVWPAPNCICSLQKLMGFPLVLSRTGTFLLREMFGVSHR